MKIESNQSIIPLEKVSLNCLLITNNNDINGNMVPINKYFFLDANGNFIKQSNAIVYDAIFEEKEFDSFQKFEHFINKLKPNQCISLGKSRNGFINGIITTKGREDLLLNKISRSNDFMSNRNTQGILFDVDPDDQMTEQLLNIRTPELLHENFTKIFGTKFQRISTLIGYGSSYGVKKKDTDEVIKVSWSTHAYSAFTNVTEKALENMIEFVKRKCIDLALWYFKIHKDGSTAYRTLIDLSVIKSARSRLIFEAPATIGEGLVQEIPESTFYNCEDGIIPFDIGSLSIEGLPDWRPVYEKEKIKQQDKINTIKEQFRKNKIEELISKYGWDVEFAKYIINMYIETKALSSSLFIKNSSDHQEYQIYQYLFAEGSKSFDVYDFLEPEKGESRSRIYVNNIFDAKITTFLRGGNTYKISFTLDEIMNILQIINLERVDINKILYALVDYVIENNFNDTDVKCIIQYLEKHSFEFGKHYYLKYIDAEVNKRMKQYAFFMFDGKSGYLDKDEEKMTFYSKPSLVDKFSNKNFYCTNPYKLDEVKEVDVIKTWTKSQNREEYYKVVFTDKETDDTTYNLFHGFPFNPIDHDDVDISLFFTLIKEVICDNDELFYNIVLSFIAQIIQDPFNKLGTCLIIAGAKGIGKGSFIKTILVLIGVYAMQTSKSDQVFGRFNGHIMYKLFIYMNEAFWSGDKSTESDIKSLTTDEDTSYEIKNGPTFEGKNYTRLILDSNDSCVVPATFDERRYIAVKASECKKGDLDFFKIVNGFRTNQKAMEKIMHFFRNFDYKPYEKHLREAPKSKFLGEQIKENFDLYQEWWYSNLTHGTIHNATYNLDGQGIRIANQELWNSFCEYHGQVKTKYIKESSFYTELKNIISDDVILKKNVKLQGTNKTGKILNSLDICRDVFVTKYHIDNFEDTLSWSLNKNIPSPIF